MNLNDSSLTRFSNRVENYIRYRPDYPAEIIPFLKQESILHAGSVIADIGSGTGISAEMFLKEGYNVTGVEPNKDMREAAERLLSTYKNFVSVSATAEATTLADKSADMILAGQAFHWFDKQKCKTEFQRILKPGGTVVLMWNDRRTKSTQFLQAYEDCINMFSTDYKEVNHQNITEQTFDDFYGKGNYSMKAFDHFQAVDFEGLKGRLLSSSYIPTEEHPDFKFMISVLKKIFTRFEENGKVKIEYDTKVYYGKL